MSSRCARKTFDGPGAGRECRDRRTGGQEAQGSRARRLRRGRAAMVMPPLRPVAVAPPLPSPFASGTNSRAQVGDAPGREAVCSADSRLGNRVQVFRAHGRADAEGRREPDIPDRAEQGKEEAEGRRGRAAEEEVEAGGAHTPTLVCCFVAASKRSAAVCRQKRPRS